MRPKLVLKSQVYLTTPVVKINLRTPAVVHLRHIRLEHRRCDTILPTIEVPTTEVTPSYTLSRAAGGHRRTRERRSSRERGREQPSLGRHDNGNQQDAHLLECQGGLRAWKVGENTEDAARFSQRTLQAL